MIPKRIIYCWFGHGEMSELNKRCMRSWAEKCPDYEIVRIDESNFDVNSNELAKAAYENGNWAFVSDVARLQALKDLGGGFYLDTDAELLRSLDWLRNCKAIVPEFAPGAYSNFFLGCGEEFPMIYQECLDGAALSLLESNESMWTLMNRLAYKYAHPLGEAMTPMRNEVTALGLEVCSAEKLEAPTTLSTVAQYEENTWVGGWTGGFKPGANFIPFNIRVNGTYTKALTAATYGGAEPPSNMVMELQEANDIDVSITGLGNYFNNPEVCEVEVPGKCVLKDTSRPKWNSVAYVNGAIIRYVRTVVAIDFDDTITELQPRSCRTTGKLNETAARCIRQMYEDGILIYIVTSREGKAAEEARRKLFKWGVPYHRFQSGIMDNGQKLQYDFIFDDRAYADRIVPWEELTEAALNLRGCRA